MNLHATTSGGLSPGQWGLLSFLLSEAALFSTLIVAYLMFDGQDARPGGLGGPKAVEVLSLGLAAVTTACLLTSSVTVHCAERALRVGRVARSAVFCSATLLLGCGFLAGTAHEWRGLVDSEGLTITRNLLGTTFFTLVGLHAVHVSAGLTALATCLILLPTRGQAGNFRDGVGLVAWYWHFVDVVWIVVFLVVYVRPFLELRMAP